MLDKVMNTNFIKFGPQDTVKEALKALTEGRVNGAPVVDDNGKLLGIIVKADIFRFLMEEGHYDTCPLDWVMTKRVIIATEDEDTIDIAKRLRENSIVAIPVVDENDVVKAMVTLESILDSIIETHKAE